MWLLLSRTVFDDDVSGLEPLLGTWGGEVIYFPMRLEDEYRDHLSSMGNPSIVVADLDLSSRPFDADHFISPSLGDCLVGGRLGLEEPGSRFNTGHRSRPAKSFRSGNRATRHTTAIAGYLASLVIGRLGRAPRAGRRTTRGALVCGSGRQRAAGEDIGDRGGGRGIGGLLALAVASWRPTADGRVARDGRRRPKQATATARRTDRRRNVSAASPAVVRPSTPREARGWSWIRRLRGPVRDGVRRVVVRKGMRFGHAGFT